MKPISSDLLLFDVRTPPFFFFDFITFLLLENTENYFSILDNKRKFYLRNEAKKKSKQKFKSSLCLIERLQNLKIFSLIPPIPKITFKQSNISRTQTLQRT